MAYGRAEQEAVAEVVRPSPGNLLSAKPNRFCPSDHRYHHERSVPTDGITAAIKAATNHYVVMGISCIRLHRRRNML